MVLDAYYEHDRQISDARLELLSKTLSRPEQEVRAIILDHERETLLFPVETLAELQSAYVATANSFRPDSLETLHGLGVTAL